MAPKYSICMCNYNMADTIERALRSILDQLNDDYEVILVDDGSSDKSVEIVQALQKEYPILRLKTLTRDPKRRLGETRNISIREAKGEYALLNIDCDDVYGPYIQDFVKAFHQLEKVVDKDFFLKGRSVNIAKREFLLEHGPYRNIYHLEDRDMWLRFAAIDAYLQMDHERFIKRLPKPTSEKIYRTIHITWSHMLIDFRVRHPLHRYFRREIHRWKKLSFRHIFLRIWLFLPAYCVAQFQPTIKMPPTMNTGEKFGKYREKNRGTFTELMQKYGGKPDFTGLSPTAKDYF